MAVDLETRVLNDLDEKIGRVVELFVQNPQLINTTYSSETGTRPEVAACYYVAFMCSHICRMRQMGILGDNEWQGWLQRMKTSFRFGSSRIT